MDEQLLELKVLLKRWEVDFLRQHKRKPSSGDVAVQPDIGTVTSRITYIFVLQQHILRSDSGKIRRISGIEAF